MRKLWLMRDFIADMAYGYRTEGRDPVWTGVSPNPHEICWTNDRGRSTATRTGVNSWEDPWEDPGVTIYDEYGLDIGGRGAP